MIHIRTFFCVFLLLSTMVSCSRKSLQVIDNNQENWIPQLVNCVGKIHPQLEKPLHIYKTEFISSYVAENNVLETVTLPESAKDKFNATTYRNDYKQDLYLLTFHNDIALFFSVSYQVVEIPKPGYSAFKVGPIYFGKLDPEKIFTSYDIIKFKQYIKTDKKKLNKINKVSNGTSYYCNCDSISSETFYKLKRDKSEVLFAFKPIGNTTLILKEVIDNGQNKLGSSKPMIIFPDEEFNIQNSIQFKEIK